MLLLKGFKLHYWPIVTSVWFILTLTTSFLISVLGEHVYPVIPYISDTGTKPPESCIFGQMLNIAALLMLITFYIRYRQVEFAINTGYITLNGRWNNCSFWLGNVVCFGMSMVANFQEGSVLVGHMIGAFTTFFVGAIYLIVQTRISYAFKNVNSKHQNHGIGINVIYLRIFLTFSFIVFFAFLLGFGVTSINQFNGKDFLWWTSNHCGFEIRLISTVSEWLDALIFIIYTLTLKNEFKAMEFEEIRFRTKYKHDLGDGALEMA